MHSFTGFCDKPIEKRCSWGGSPTSVSRSWKESCAERYLCFFLFDKLLTFQHQHNNSIVFFQGGTTESTGRPAETPSVSTDLCPSFCARPISSPSRLRPGTSSATQAPARPSNRLCWKHCGRNMWMGWRRQDSWSAQEICMPFGSDRTVLKCIETIYV